MSTADVVDVPTDLRSWARGMYNTEAACELLIRAFDGRFTHCGYPWIVVENDHARLDVEHLLLAVLHEPGGRGQRAVAAAGKSPRAVERRLSRALRGQPSGSSSPSS